jgi:tRNA A37 methylthiotransferase MiaB
MSRQYRADEYLEMIDRVQAALDRPAISTDIVVGFCGETDEDFQQTIDLVGKVGFCRVHAFPFSPREGTPAYKWANQRVNGGVVRHRMSRLRTLADQAAAVFKQQFVGATERVLVEGLPPNPRSALSNFRSEGLLHGRTDRYFEVQFPEPDHRTIDPGDLVNVRIRRVDSAKVYGELIGASNDDDAER